MIVSLLQLLWSGFRNGPKQIDNGGIPFVERVSKRNEEYKISGISDEKEKRTLEISVNFEKWNALENGQTVKVKIYKTGTATLVD